jgi:ABC-type bacteriocin/lantibiotic exporter with double-glycine peptidase domain
VPEQTWSAGPLTLRRLDTGDTMELPPGTRLAVVGPSGVGKTTWLESLAALGPDSSPLAQSTGSLSNVAEDVLRVHLRYVPAEPGFVEGVARDVVALGGASATVWDDLASVGLPLSPNDRLTGLSRGQRQRLAVVRALASRPDVLILDEPTSGLGSADTRAVLALLERVGSTVIVATHDPDVIAWCETVIDLGATR